MSAVRVTAPARLHLGMVDVAGGATRRFGGIGVGIDAPCVVLRASRAEVAGASGPSSDRALGFLRDACAALGVGDGVHVSVEQAIPGHHGLGSGTKLGLAVARAVCALEGLDLDAAELARVAGRGARSAVGVWTFAAPGLVVEAGPRADADGIGPLLGRWAMPPDWRCVLAIPHGAPGLSGRAEQAFFDAAPQSDTATVAQQVLTALLPALVEADVEEFGRALTTIQRLVGETFADAQGGVFHPHTAPLVDALAGLGCPGVGQSSWGPAAYGVFGDPERAEWARAQMAARLGGDVTLSVVDFDRRGATVDVA